MDNNDKYDIRFIIISVVILSVMIIKLIDSGYIGNIFIIIIVICSFIEYLNILKQ